MSVELSNPVIADFEFVSVKGGTPVPHTLCAIEVRTGKIHKYGPSELAQLDSPPFPPDHTLIAFAADAELSCYLALGWPLPESVIDLRVEHMMFDLNTATVEHLGANLEGALAHYGMSHAVENKTEMQKLAGLRVPEAAENIENLKAYCFEDCVATKKLWDVMEAKLDDSSIYRGRYMMAVARIHERGIPFDVETFNLIKEHAAALKMIWIRKLDPNHEIFDVKGTFKMNLFTEYLRKRDLLAAWPKTKKTHQPSRDSNDLRDVIASNPDNKELVKLVELFNTVNLLKNFKLHLDDAGRNRVDFFNAFGTKTGRNAQTGYIYMQAKWVRSLMKPAPGMAMAYMDWNSMEVGVGAVLSGDEKLIDAYTSGDAHMMLAKQGGMVPPDATKDAKTSPYSCGADCGGETCKHLPSCDQFSDHCDIRSQCKTCNLAAMYGATVTALMKKGLTKEQARRALKHHHQVYSVFWEWIEDRIEEADVLNEATTLDGWRIHVDGEHKGFNARSVGNFFVQANSAAIMRLAAILATERGLGICAVVHDAFLLEAPIEDMQRQVTELKECMDEASAVLLDGFVLGVDGWQPEKWIVYPNRYMDERGRAFWAEVETALEGLTEKETV